jgi:anti-sigma B factor antagonist
VTDLSIHTHNTKDVSVMRLIGTIDSDSTPHLEEALSKIVQDHNKIVLNLQHVEYMSSAGLRAIVRAYQAVKKTGGDVHLANVPERVEGVLLTVGLNQMLKSYPNDQEAVAGF